MTTRIKPERDPGDNPTYQAHEHFADILTYVLFRAANEDSPLSEIVAEMEAKSETSKGRSIFESIASAVQGARCAIKGRKEPIRIRL